MKINKILITIIIPLILLIICFIAALIVSSPNGITTLNYLNDSQNLQTNDYKKLLYKQKINGEFVASENNLGIINIHFIVQKYVPDENEDLLRFRFREKGSPIWYYQSNYSSGLIYGVNMFPFGFPIIENSKGKTYIFEIESLKGNLNNGISLSRNEPLLTSSYKFEKQELLHNKKLLLQFIWKKIMLYLTNYDALANTLFCYLPFMLFYLWRISKRFYKLNAIISMFVIIAMLYSLFSTYVNEFIIILFTLWLYFVIYYHIESKVSIIYSFAFFLIALIAITLNNQMILIPIGSYAYIFLLIGIIQMLLEVKFPTKRIIGYRGYFNIFLKK